MDLRSLDYLALLPSGVGLPSVCTWYASALLCPSDVGRADNAVLSSDYHHGDLELHGTLFCVMVGVFTSYFTTALEFQ